jgi:hypothetical protein
MTNSQMKQKEPKKKKQTMRFNDEELELIKHIFAENDDLLKAIRKVFYQIPINALDRALLQTNVKLGPLQKVLQKMFSPTIDMDMPFGQQMDFWLLSQIKDKFISEGAVHLKSIKIAIDYLDQQLKVLQDPKLIQVEGIQLKDLEDITDKTDSNMYAEMMARNTIINQVEGGLNQLIILAGRKNETVEETLKRLGQDSNK